MHKKSLAIDEKVNRQEGMANHYAGRLGLGLLYQRRGELDSAEACGLRPTQQYLLHGRIEFPILPAPRKGPSNSAS